LNPFEFGIADSEESDSRTHRADARVMASLFVAFFAYIGLALGGGITLTARADAESFSSGKDNQPLYLSLRDTVRGIVIAERMSAPKGNWHDAGPAALAAPPVLAFLGNNWQPHDAGNAPSRSSVSSNAYHARAPPVVDA
jgi:hypothetical protein